MELWEAKRILVLGICGGGKTTLALQLGKALGLPVIHLDQEYWNPGWVETPREEWREKVESLCRKPEWVMDGNYGGTIEARLAHADAAVLLERGRFSALWGVVRRVACHYGKTRADMGRDCPERFDREFLRYTWDFPKKQLPGLLELLAAHPEVPVIRLKRRKEAQRLVAACEKEKAGG